MRVLPRTASRSRSAVAGCELGLRSTLHFLLGFPQLSECFPGHSASKYSRVAITQGRSLGLPLAPAGGGGATAWPPVRPQCPQPALGWQVPGAPISLKQ